ncbi:hypothetical protein D3C76_1285260 [compost metagenome]
MSGVSSPRISAAEICSTSSPLGEPLPGIIGIFWTRRIISAGFARASSSSFETVLPMLSNVPEDQKKSRPLRA